MVLWCNCRSVWPAPAVALLIAANRSGVSRKLRGRKGASKWATSFHLHPGEVPPRRMGETIIHAPIVRMRLGMASKLETWAVLTFFLLSTSAAPRRNGGPLESDVAPLQTKSTYSSCRRRVTESNMSCANGNALQAAVKMANLKSSTAHGRASCTADSRVDVGPMVP